MRKHGVYSLYRRVMKTGLVVYYYQSYDELGRRLPGRSTGKSTKTAARAFCDALLAEGLLFNGEQVTKVPLFKDYAKGWWDYGTCEYVKNREKRLGRLAENYLLRGRLCVKNYLLPAFGSLRLNQITEEVIDSWLDRITGEGLKHTSAKAHLKILSVMLQWAVKRHKYLKYNPCRNIEALSDDTAASDILKLHEVKALFPDDWSSVWDDYLSYLVCKTAAYTGMRYGEVMGIKCEFLHDGYIHVAGQYTAFGYAPVKMKKPRYVTVSAGLEGELRRLADGRGDGFLFCRDAAKGEMPNRNTVYRHLYLALSRIGICEEERRARRLTFHGFRHFFNTYMLAGQVPDDKVMAMTGHRSKMMKERYTHFDPGMFGEVRAMQERLAGGPVKAPLAAG